MNLPLLTWILCRQCSWHRRVRMVRIPSSFPRPMCFTNVATRNRSAYACANERSTKQDILLDRETCSLQFNRAHTPKPFFWSLSSFLDYSQDANRGILPWQLQPVALDASSRPDAPAVQTRHCSACSPPQTALPCKTTQTCVMILT